MPLQTGPKQGPWRIATRRSRLAQAQSEQFGKLLSDRTGRPVELVPMATTGDEQPDRAIESFDAKGLFVDRTRQAVLAGECDFVVHSYKDLPTEPAPGLVIGAIPARVDPRDVLVSRDGWRLASIPRGAPVTVGTSSIRRKAQLQKARRDLLVQPLRGNLDTRLGKVASGDLDAVVVALAGLLRFGPIDLDLKAVPLEHGELLHAPAQGALAIECREDDLTTRAALVLVDDKDTRACVAAERALLAALEGGCTAPIGAHAEILPAGSGNRQLELLGLLADPSGTRVLRASHHGSVEQPELLGETLAATLAVEGEDVLERLRSART